MCSQDWKIAVYVRRSPVDHHIVTYFDFPPLVFQILEIHTLLHQIGSDWLR